MINFKLLTTAAAFALALPLAMPSASFAFPHHGGAPHVAGIPGGGRPGGNFHPGGGQHFGGGGYRHHGGFGAGVAAGIAGAAIGNAFASQYYDGGYYDAGPAYYDGGYYDDGAVAVVPDAGGDSTAYCMQRYRSYDPQSGTYLGFDGLRHPCP